MGDQRGLFPLPIPFTTPIRQLSRIGNRTFHLHSFISIGSHVRGGGYISRVTVYKVVIYCILNLLPPMDVVTTNYFKFPVTL